MITNGLSLFDLIEYLIDQQFILEETEACNSEFEDTKLFDVEKIIESNHSFNDYFNAIRESYAQICNFWDYLSNFKNLNVIELFE
jgi:hypothetical protein